MLNIPYGNFMSEITNIYMMGAIRFLCAKVLSVGSEAYFYRFDFFGGCLCFFPPFSNLYLVPVINFVSSISLLWIEKHWNVKHSAEIFYDFAFQI